jgi:tRNA pseudouridine55 synthase
VIYKNRKILVNGWIAIDKPLGITSANVVTKVRSLTGVAKIGHGGTLDPLASGILPLALGEATKTIAYVMNSSKTYRCNITWGESRSTDDSDGDIIDINNKRPNIDEIKIAINQFIGKIEQIPPIYSAVKINGQRAYDLARKKKHVNIKSRTVQINSFVLTKASKQVATFEINCEKGTYIRSLARDLAKTLGTVGYVSELRRTICGSFNELNAISLDMLKNFDYKLGFDNLVLPVETVLNNVPSLVLTADEAHRLKNGQSIPISKLMERNPGMYLFLTGTTVQTLFENRLIALARIDDVELYPVRVLNL